MLNTLAKHSAVLILALLINHLTQAVGSQPRLVDRIFAIVDNQLILKSEFDQAWLEFSTSLNQPSSNIRQLKQRLLEQMITVRIQIEEANKRGIRINQRELNEQIQVIANNNNLSVPQLFSQLQQAGIQPPQFRRNIQQQIIIQRLQQSLLAGTINIDPQEVDKQYQRQLIINDPYEYQYRLILIENTNQQQPSRLQQRTAQVLQALQQGLAFNEAITLYSDLPNNSHLALNWIDSSSIPDNFQAFLRQAKNNQTSAVISTERGNFIVQLIDKRIRQPFMQTRYRFQLITLSKRIYERSNALETYNQVLDSNNPQQAMVEFAKQLSQDRYAFKGGRTDWLSSQDVAVEISRELGSADLNKPRFVSTDQDWIIYQVLDKQLYDASQTVIKNRIRQQLLNNQLQKNYSETLKNLRQNTPVKILVDFQQDATK